MLSEILRLLQSGGIRSLDEVARRLHVEPAMAQAMIEDLARHGYLESVALSGTCGEGTCGGCALADACGVGNSLPLRTFMLTDRGRKATAA